MPARLVNVAAPAPMLMLPAVPGVGTTTTSVAWVPLTRVKLPLLPPATIRSSVVKLPPTSSLKLKVTSPVAMAPAALLPMDTVGATVSGAGAGLGAGGEAGGRAGAGAGTGAGTGAGIGAVSATLSSDYAVAPLGNAGLLRRFSISGDLSAGVGGGVGLNVIPSIGDYQLFQVFVNRSLVQSVDTALVVSVRSAVPESGTWARMLAGWVGVVGMSAHRRRG